VVVPTFNRAYCLGRALDSILGQTHQDLEVILIDDGSTDDTRGFIKNSYGRDGRIKYVYQENRGVTATRNQGLRLTQGEYVAFLDSDDTWEPWKLQLQLACLQRCPEIGMVWTDMEAVGPDGTIVNPNYLRTMYHAYRWFTDEQLFTQTIPLDQIELTSFADCGRGTLFIGDIFSAMVMGNLVHTSTVLLRRERLDKVQGFNEDLRVSGEDYDFHLRTCKHGPVGFINLASIRYQVGMADRLSADRYKLYAARNCLRTILPILEKDHAQIRLPRRMIRSRLAEVHDWIGGVALEMCHNSPDDQDTLELLRDARRHLLASLRYRPWQPRTLRLLAIAVLPFSMGRVGRKIFRSLKSSIRGAVATSSS
jgi:glycosyltransferase involved in cell wall biosynthesis